MHSLNTRTLLGAGAVLVIFMLLTALALERAFIDSARTAQQERLLGQLYLLMGETEVAADGQLQMPARSGIARLNQPDSGLYALIHDGGNIAWQSRSTMADTRQPAHPLQAGEQQFRHLDEAGLFVLGIGVEWLARDRAVPLSFTLLEDTRSFEAQIAGYRRTLWGWLSALGVGLLAALVLVLRWGLRPLRHVTRDLSAIEQGRQTHLEGDYPQELQGLTGNLNALLDHERARQQRYQHALGDLAHSLKTPLAVLRGAPADSPDKATLRQCVEEQVTLMDSIVSRELQRAATRGQVTLAAPLRVHQQLDRLVAALHKVYRDKAMRVANCVPETMRLRMDAGDFTELFGNLLDNAFKYGAHRIRIAATQDTRKCVLTVENDGTTLEQADARQALQRGSRRDQSMPGQGIGLAVAQDIVTAYEGSLQLGAAEHGGTIVTLALPRY
ncbi:MAG: ATP-binding protein [Granulosicoccaceae bacterium]|jgi:two-component system sensor histidine kinase PhoQ